MEALHNMVYQLANKQVATMNILWNSAPSGWYICIHEPAIIVNDRIELDSFKVSMKQEYHLVSSEIECIHKDKKMLYGPKP